MGDRPLTEADMEGLRGELVNLKTQMADLLTALNNQFAVLPQQIANVIQGGGGQRGPNPNQQRGNHPAIVVPARVQQGGNNQRPGGNNRQQDRRNRVVVDNSSSEEDSEAEIVEEEVEQRNRQGNHDYRVKAHIPMFNGTMGVEEFLDWQIDVDRFFEVVEVPENKQVKMVAIRLKKTAAVWWDKLVVQRQRQRKGPVQTWRRMKQLMMEKILYKMYIECVQGKRTVTEYTAEFLRSQSAMI